MIKLKKIILLNFFTAAIAAIPPLVNDLKQVDYSYPIRNFLKSDNNLPFATIKTTWQYSGYRGIGALGWIWWHREGQHPYDLLHNGHRINGPLSCFLYAATQHPSLLKVLPAFVKTYCDHQELDKQAIATLNDEQSKKLSVKTCIEIPLLKQLDKMGILKPFNSVTIETNMTEHLRNHFHSYTENKKNLSPEVKGYYKSIIYPKDNIPLEKEKDWSVKNVK